MNFNNSLKAITLGVALGATVAASAADVKKFAILAEGPVATLNAQEKAAAEYIQSIGGDVLTPETIDQINNGEYEALMIHIDRLFIGAGVDNLPAAFTDFDTFDAVAEFVEEGGNVYLSKHATQLITKFGRLPENWNPRIFGDGDGGMGSDVWCVNAQIGSWMKNPGNAEQDPTQYYDRSTHAIYNGLVEFAPSTEWNNYPHKAYPMEGTGTGVDMHREDHNCCWDLNNYNEDQLNLWGATEGKNTIEKFESKWDCTVIGTWGHVQDYCVAGIVEFNPTATISGKIIANGLAACEWAPRNNDNAYGDNLKLLTKNVMGYLAPNASTQGIEAVAVEAAQGEAVYYNLQGMRVANPENGVFVRVQGNKAAKVRF